MSFQHLLYKIISQLFTLHVLSLSHIPVKGCTSTPLAMMRVVGLLSEGVALRLGVRVILKDLRPSDVVPPHEVDDGQRGEVEEDFDA